MRTAGKIASGRRGVVATIVALALLAAALATTPANARAANAAPTTTDASRAAVAPAGDPMAQVQSGVAEVIALFRDPGMPLKTRRAKLGEVADRYFDFAAMARSVMGYHWRTLTPAQRAEFVPLFTEFIKDAYLTKLQDYAVKKVQRELPAVRFNYAREAFDGSDYATVYSTIVVPEQKDPIAVNYLMHRTNGEWRVYDLTIAAIDVIANYRTQFNHVLNQDGYDKLMTTLREKQQALRRELARPTPPAA